jgi:hypothetical protein
VIGISVVGRVNPGSAAMQGRRLRMQWECMAFRRGKIISTRVICSDVDTSKRPASEGGNGSSKGDVIIAMSCCLAVFVVDRESALVS